MCVYEEVCYVEGSQCVEYIHIACEECGEGFCLPKETTKNLATKYCSKCIPADNNK